MLSLYVIYQLTDADRVTGQLSRSHSINSNGTFSRSVGYTHTHTHSHTHTNTHTHTHTHKHTQTHTHTHTHTHTYTHCLSICIHQNINQKLILNKQTQTDSE